jgi:hypothetical protein
MPKTLLLAVAAALCLTHGRPAAQQEASKMIRAAGTFDVKLAPQSLADSKADPLLGRMSMDKQFAGDLQANSKGEMLTARTATEGSAGYVAIERVTGSLGGRKGSFVLQHTGTMTRGEQHFQTPERGTWRGSPERCRSRLPTASTSTSSCIRSGDAAP